MGKAWVKEHIDTWSDKRFRSLSHVQRLCWLGVWALAGDCDEDGQASGRLEMVPGCPLTDEQIARWIDVPAEEWRQARAELLRLQVLEQNGDMLVVREFHEEQMTPAALRMRRMRGRERNSDVTQLRSSDAMLLPHDPQSDDSVQTSTGMHRCGGLERNSDVTVTRTVTPVVTGEAEADADTEYRVVGQPCPASPGGSRRRERKEPYLGCLTPEQRAEILSSLAQVPTWSTVPEGEWVKCVNTLAKRHEQDPNTPARLRDAALEFALSRGLCGGKPVDDLLGWFRGIFRRVGKEETDGDAGGKRPPTANARGAIGVAGEQADGCGRFAKAGICQPGSTVDFGDPEELAAALRADTQGAQPQPDRTGAAEGPVHTPEAGAGDPATVLP